MKCNKHKRASVLVMALLFITIIAVLAETVLLSVNSRAFATYQSASWHEALNAAEAGSDYGVATLNSMATYGTSAWTGWTQASGTSGFFTSSTTGTGSLSLSGSFTHSGQGNQKMYFTVTISNNVLMSSGSLPSPLWYRIKSVGTAEIPGPARVTYEKSILDYAGLGRADSTLRKITFTSANDRTGGYCHVPQVTRTIQVIEEPLTTQGIFIHALTLSTYINMSGGQTFTNSYNSNQTGGPYIAADATNRGDIAVNTTINNSSISGGATIHGNISYDGGSNNQVNSSTVTGSIFNNYSTTMPAPTPPVWNTASTVAQTSPTVINVSSGTQTLAAGASASAPMDYELTSLTVSSGHSTLEITNPNASGAPAYINIWVNGKTTMSGGSQMIIDKGVYVTFYCEGDVDFSGGSITNTNQLASDMVIYGLAPAGEPNPTFKASGGSAFYAAVDAPAFDFTDSGGSAFIGAGIFNSATISGGSSFIYDQALSSYGTSGSGSNFEMASWIEDVRDKVGLSGSSPP